MTGNVTWLSPAACDPGKRAADMPQGTRRGGQAMRVLVTEDDEILAAASRPSPDPAASAHPAQAATGSWKTLHNCRICAAADLPNHERTAG